MPEEKVSIAPEDLRSNLQNYYLLLLAKDYRYQMGDDDHALSTKELNVCRALKVILHDLRNP